MAESYRSVPQAAHFFIGGSSTFALRFPEDLAATDVEVVERKLVFHTPFGDSPAMKLFTIAGRPVLTMKMHGWRPGVTRADASRQVFWVMRAAGVRQILAEGGVGVMNHLVELGDLICPTDYLDFSQRRDVDLGSGHLLTMRDPICPTLHGQLRAAAQQVLDQRGDRRRVFGRGIYANTDGRHFESRAEVRALAQLGADLVGQSLCPEVYLAREIGACYAGLYLAVNYAEGVVMDWRHEDLKGMFFDQAALMGEIILTALRRVLALHTTPADCPCPGLRHPTLLQDREYAAEVGEGTGC